MQINNKIGWGIRIIFLWMIFSLHACCNDKEENEVIPICIASNHSLMALVPDFSIQTVGNTLHTKYPKLSRNKEFPMIEILKVDGKSYRFMGGDSLRPFPLVPLSTINCGWPARYSYLHPKDDWMRKEYDDKEWYNGLGAWGAENRPYPIHSTWTVADIYIRRHFNINDKKKLEGYKLYVCSKCDDHAEIYCNGEPIYQVDYFSNRIECKQLSDEVVAKLHNGDNVIAAHGWNTKENALLDFGLYMENKTYNDVDMAILKQMNVQATQTHYIYQCGDVELYLDFVSPSLLLEQCLMGCPVGFISYQIHSGKSEIHDVEILFDIDTEWMFGKNRVESLSEQDWCIVKSDSLYMGIAAEETAYSYNEGHVLLSQKLGKNKKDQGVLLFGFNEGKGLQYEGEILHPYWNKDGKRELKDALLFIGDNYKKLMRECDRLDGQLNRRAFQTRIPSFARQMILDYRKFISEHRFVMSQSGDLFCFGDTLANVRESYSNFPILLSLNRMDWMKGLLEPVFEYCENDYWRKSYPPYDIGIYPIANRQVKVDDYAVEMAADMLIMITAIVEAEQDFGYADAHWNLLCLWADYLREKMKKEVYPCGGLLNEDDERVKCVLGLMAYRKLIQLKESV